MLKGLYSLAVFQSNCQAEVLSNCQENLKRTFEISQKKKEKPETKPVVCTINKPQEETKPTALAMLHEMESGLGDFFLPHSL